jgi:hypothetical protein
LLRNDTDAGEKLLVITSVSVSACQFPPIIVCHSNSSVNFVKTPIICLEQSDQGLRNETNDILIGLCSLENMEMSIVFSKNG